MKDVLLFLWKAFVFTFVLVMPGAFTYLLLWVAKGIIKRRRKRAIEPAPQPLPLPAFSGLA